MRNIKNELKKLYLKIYLFHMKKRNNQKKEARVQLQIFHGQFVQVYTIEKERNKDDYKTVGELASEENFENSKTIRSSYLDLKVVFGPNI